MPPELEWLANITNPQTRCAYNEVGESSAFTDLRQPAELRTVTRPCHRLAQAPEGQAHR